MALKYCVAFSVDKQFLKWQKFDKLNFAMFVTILVSFLNVRLEFSVTKRYLKSHTTVTFSLQQKQIDYIICI